MELKELVEQQNIAFDELKKELSKGENSSKEKEAKLQAELDNLEVKNQEIVQKQIKIEKEAIEQKEAIELLEKKMYRLPAGMDASEKTAHYKAFEKAIITGFKNMTIEEEKYLRTDNNVSGGFLAPAEYRNELIKDITEISGVRNLARVINTSRGSVEFPKRTGLLTGSWVGEGGAQVESQSTYGLDIINTKECSVYSIVTHKMINDGAFNIVEEIRKDVTETFAKLEGTAFVSGANVNQPEGFMANASVASVNSGVANAITGDSIIAVAAELKTGYNPKYVFNRKTMSAIRKLKDGQGNYLWTPGLSAGLPNMLNGYAYVELPDMSDEGADLYPVAFGDFARAYYIVDGMQLMIIRDDYTLASEGKVKFNFLKSVGAKVVLPEAIKKIKCSL